MTRCKKVVVKDFIAILFWSSVVAYFWIFGAVNFERGHFLPKSKNHIPNLNEGGILTLFYPTFCPLMCMTFSGLIFWRAFTNQFNEWHLCSVYLQMTPSTLQSRKRRNPTERNSKPTNSSIVDFPFDINTSMFGGYNENKLKPSK